MMQSISAPRRCVKRRWLDDAPQSQSRPPMHIRASLHHARSDAESIPTGKFSEDAIDYVGRIDPHVVLVDGRQLAEYMIDYELAVTARAKYELKRIDSAFFNDE